jgi:hypothetical protein
MIVSTGFVTVVSPIIQPLVAVAAAPGLESTDGVIELVLEVGNAIRKLLVAPLVCYVDFVTHAESLSIDPFFSRKTGS